MDWQLYVKLSAMMFFQYAIWGAWMPVLAARLLGPLKMTGKQTGWIYATLPLACIVSPLAAGQIADRYINTELMLSGCHLIGAFLLFVAAWRTDFKCLFAVMLLYSLFYAATLPLVNSLMFTHLVKSNLDVGKCSPAIFIWAPVAWALAGYFLTGWRWTFKTAGQGRDCLVLAAVLSVVMAIACSFLPDTPPAKSSGTPILQTFQMLGQSNFLVFIIISIGAAGVMQFYFQGTAQFMQDMGISGKNVPAVMAIAQVTQAMVTYFVLSRLIGAVNYKWTLTIGAACWLVLYIVYVATKPRWLIIAAQTTHGFAYVFFIIAGQMFANTLAVEEIRSSMQALVFAATSGVGLFLGTQLAGIVMDKYRIEGKFQWRQVFTVPCAIIAACVLALLVLFRG